MSEQPNHDRLVSEIAQQVRSLALLSEHVGQLFASSQSLHPTDFRALSMIYEAERAGEPLAPLGLARALNLSPGAVTYAVDRLAESGHVWRDLDETDGRRVVLRVAPHGIEVAAAFFGPLGQSHARALAAYSDDELRVCHRFLGDVLDSLAGFQSRGRGDPDD